MERGIRLFISSPFLPNSFRIEAMKAIALVQRGSAKDFIMKGRSLSKRAVNYWCLILGIAREKTAAFKDSSTVWSPLR